MSLHVFGVRHHSPSASWHLLSLLDRVNPDRVLVECPADAEPWIVHLTDPGVKPPVALMAYTDELPARSMLLPFAEYSPELTALRWAAEHGAEVRFIDLPSPVFLALQDCIEEEPSGDKRPDPHRMVAESSGYPDYDSYWEANFEHILADGFYQAAARELGVALRGLDRPFGFEAETLVREAHMRRVIAREKGDRTVVVCGAYHAPVLEEDSGLPPMSDEEFDSLPRRSAVTTIMPYNNLRLSSRTGYGAGNRSPRYFGLLWEAMNSKSGIGRTASLYLTEAAAYMRESGMFRSPAEAIEGVRLALALAGLRGQCFPTLYDLRSAAVTCLGQGDMAVCAEALNAVEIGTDIGELPEGISRSSIQDDFYRELARLKLERYKSPVAMDLELDLRENRMAKGEEARFLDLRRSCFLNRLEALGVGFAQKRASGQKSATWKELFVLCWSPEAEIQLVENVLRGETVELAAAHSIRERFEDASSVDEIAGAIETALDCGLPDMMHAACSALQAFSVDACGFTELSPAIKSLANTLNYGGIRRIDTEGLKPLLAQLFLRATLALPGAASCGNSAASAVLDGMFELDKISLDFFELVDGDGWQSALDALADSDALNPLLSGAACSLLCERGLIDDGRLELLLGRRLSPGIPADIGAGWFEGLSRRNHYGLISRIRLWELLSGYIDSLGPEEFKRALLFLRRAFSDFTVAEKRTICDMLAEVLGIHKEEAEDLVMDLSENDQAMIDSLNEFDFGDL
ncbi:MAG: DUF5682 family protein [Clostridiales bacterium]|nr:DUF5682 family protein [Clostridiales bacterium]